MNHGEERIVLASVAFVVSTFDFNSADFLLISLDTLKRSITYICNEQHLIQYYQNYRAWCERPLKMMYQSNTIIFALWFTCSTLL